MTFKFKVGSEIRQKFGPFQMREGLVSVEDEAGRLVEESGRVSLDGPNAAAVLIHDTGTQDIILVRQWRFPVGGDTLEIPAGLIDGNEFAEDAARREVFEETGVQLGAEKLAFIAETFMAPGMSPYAVTVFYAPVSMQATPPRKDVAGEYCQILRIPVPEFVEMAATGVIRDAKTAIAAFWCIANGKFGD
jgi:ADP-ribose pyrophosphatase